MFRSLLEGEDGALILKGLETSSVSAIDAETRAEEWDSTFANLDEMVQERNYSAGSPGYSTSGLHGIEFFDATVAAIIKSYAGIFAVERGMNQPNASLPYYNSYGVKSGQLITPNLGVSQTMTESDGYIAENFTVPVANAGSITVDVNSTAPLATLENIPIVPGSVKITMTFDGVSHNITDNGNGTLLAEPGLLTAGSITYGFGNATPAINFDSTLAAAAGTDTDVVIEYIQDQPAKLSESIKGEIEYYRATTSPIIIPYEINQVTNLTAKKSLKIDMRQMTLDQVTNEYTKVVNKRVAENIKLSADSNNEVTLDLSNFSVQTSDFRTYLESFMGQLKMIDTVLVKKTEKASKITAYLVSMRLGDIFRQLDFVTSKWVPNKDISYVDDVVGYYNEIPVVRSKWVEDAIPEQLLQGYAIHKTKEGHLAPLMRGMFLPLTNMNEVGSFNNPLLKSGGIFSYEGMSRLTNDLTVGFQLKPGTGTIIS